MPRVGQPRHPSSVTAQLVERSRLLYTSHVVDRFDLDLLDEDPFTLASLRDHALDFTVYDSYEPCRIDITSPSQHSQRRPSSSWSATTTAMLAASGRL